MKWSSANLSSGNVLRAWMKTYAYRAAPSLLVGSIFVFQREGFLKWFGIFLLAWLMVETIGWIVLKVGSH